MKQDISSIDVAVVSFELSKFITGAKIGKIYQHSPDEIRITLQVVGRGRENLVIEAGRRVHLTSYPKQAEQLPQAFPMLLRKHLTGGRIAKIEQHDFDRILKIHVERAGIKTILLCEFFARGNIVLLNEEERIILPLKSISYRDRTLRGGEIYELPPPQLNPLSLTVGQLAEIFAASHSDAVRTLAVNLNMGGVLSEEVCLRAGIDKNTQATHISLRDCEKLHRALQDMLSPLASGEFQPHIVREKGVNIDVLPYELQRYEKFEKVYFSTFNQALDEYYGKTEMKKLQMQQEAKKSKLGLYERRLAQQEASLEKFREEEQHLTHIGDMLYSEYALINEILSAIRRAREKNYTWEEIKKIIANSDLPSAKLIKNIDSSTGSITVNLHGIRATLDHRLSVEQNAAVYYEGAKKFSSKIKGALKAIDKTRELMNREEVVEKKKKSMPRRRKTKWYEQFKWFHSSDGFLIIGGRDAETNETLVKKYMEKRDLFFHTQYPGSPAVIIKTEGREVPETTLRETAQFTVSHSNIWKSGLFEGECYWVLPEQVSKTPEHGEYLPRGSFVIRGRRNYLKASVGVAIGIKDGECIGGPPSSIKERADYLVELEPGEFNQNDISKKIYRIFTENAEDPRAIKAGASPDIIARFLPPGGSRIKAQKP
jgi:predicted ribosome quality control (RQC) complex YloA/Tae2 family protein